MNIDRCPCTLEIGHNAYSPKAQKKMFGGKKIAHVLPFNLEDFYANNRQEAIRQRTQISISGAQEKYMLVLDAKNKILRFPIAHEQTTYILKPSLQDRAFQFATESPANEHLTMQIASQVYKMRVAENALIFFDNGELAYLTKRFDIEGDTKIAQEDFATLLGYSRENAGEGFRAKGSYEAIARKMKECIPAYAIEAERFFAMILFNYLFSNGDAHLKNFSLQQIGIQDYALAPCYDLLNTRLHLPHDTALALDLFDDDYFTPSYEKLGFYAYPDFYEFGLKIGIRQSRLQKIMDFFGQHNPLTNELITRSFLSEECKKMYAIYYQDRLKALSIGI
jgi:serine/threonine-protein kinase HipA